MLSTSHRGCTTSRRAKADVLSSSPSEPSHATHDERVEVSTQEGYRHESPGYRDKPGDRKGNIDPHDRSCRFGRGANRVRHREWKKHRRRVQKVRHSGRLTGCTPPAADRPRYAAFPAVSHGRAIRPLDLRSLAKSRCCRCGRGGSPAVGMESRCPPHQSAL